MKKQKLLPQQQLLPLKPKEMNKTFQHQALRNSPLSHLLFHQISVFLHLPIRLHNNHLNQIK